MSQPTESADGNPGVTVAMVTHNSEAYVAEAIESVLAQEYTDFELLICDDCSSDATWSIVCGYRDSRIRRFRNESNIGEYPNRNSAVSLARGRFIFFLDGDDILYPDGLGFMVRMLEEFPEAGFAASQPYSEKFIYPVELTSLEFLCCQFLGPNVLGRDFTHLLFRTESLRAAGGFDARFRSGDTHIQFRIALDRGCVLVSDAIAWWRRRPGQASESLLRDRWGMAEYVRYGRETLEDPRCPLSGPEKEIARSNLCRALLRNVVRYIRSGRVVHAYRLLRRAGISVRDWRYLLARDRRPYLGDVDGRNPIKLRISAPVSRNPRSHPRAERAL